VSGKRWLIPVAALLGILLALGIHLAQSTPYQFVGTVFSDQEVAPDFTLTADNGSPASLGDYRGDVVLLYFGYTYCPDVCPTVLATLASARKALGPSDRDRVQVLMVTVDPARDTPDVMRSYLEHFDPAFVGLTGTDEEIAAVAADYNVTYEKHEGTAATGYLVDHWAGVYLIDPAGDLVESFSFGTPADEVAADVTQWL
jgi:protein SCO1/2